ncbi:putative indole-3-acetic acid-amido synthetase GH3.9 [Perilla frutescens var. frutescens]|nr:putative indole-3-acetic acid-amido synthetase GH3.9 [Perilla frutescens var. frutescens]
MDGKKLEYKGARALKELERLTTKAGEVQQEILRKILEQNWDTEYLKKYLGDSSISSKSVVQFKSRVPAIGYKEIGPYIVRIANGEDSNLITGHPIIEMLCSSGTSAGEPKLMPSIAEDLDRRTFVYNLIMPIVNQHVPGLDEGKAMYLYFVKSETSTPCGMAARTVLTSYYNSSHFKHRPHDPYNDFTSPDAAILCNDSHQSMYCQLLAGLIHRRRVLRLGAVFASALLRAISFLERHWRDFCRDIRAGDLDPAVSDPACRSALLRLLGPPDPDAAAEIEGICGGAASWRGIVCKLWPNAKYIEAVVTGSMSQYVTALSRCAIRPRFPSRYFPMGYFEFIPLAGDNGSLSMEDDEAPPPLTDLVELVDVKLGCYYELVVTTFSGLYRYRIGDVLQVTGFHNEAPQFRFICRRNVVLSIDNDKTNEEDLHRSITAAASRLLEPRHALLVEYTSYADTSSIPGHYVIYWEINDAIQLHAPPISANVLRECCITVEEGLDYVYRRCRTNDRSVGPLEIRVVKPGTFEKLMDLFIAQGGASINQYKTPRCVKSKPALKLLNANVSDCYFSPRDPAWHA